MIDRLSIPNLLKLLAFSQKDVFSWYENVDSDNLITDYSHHTELTSNVGHQAKADVVRQLCERAEVFRKLRRYKEAVEIAAEAAQIAHNAFDYNLQGVALLHLSAARTTFAQPELDKRAISDCNRAIRDFCLDSHNYSIALIIRAQMQLQIYRADDNEVALSYLRKASRSLEKIIAEFYGPNKCKCIENYQGLTNDVNIAIDELVGSRTKIRPLPITPKLVNRSAVPHPNTIDMLSGAIQVAAQRSIPILNISAYAGTPTSEYPDYSAVNYIEIADQISLFGRPYTLRWPDDTKHGHHTLQLRADMDYVAVLVKGESMRPTLEPDDYVLVRKQAYHEFDRQLVVVTLGSQSESSPTESIVKRAIGYPAIKWLESDNPQKAKYPRLYCDDSDLQPHLFGIVEAVLQPIV